MTRDPSGPRVAVTGATGFVGSRVMKHLIDRGCTVLALVRASSNLDRLRVIDERFQCVYTDMDQLPSVTDQIHEFRPQTLVHLAWYAEPRKYLEAPRNLADLQASINLLEHARSWGCNRIVGVGTCLEYDTSYGYLSESTPLAPRSLYASAKAALFLLARGWAAQAGIAFVWCRLFHLFGAAEDKRRLVPTVITSLLDGQIVTIRDGEIVRDYLNVDDAASAVATIALGDYAGPINIASGEPVLIRDIAMSIGRQMDSTKLIQFDPRSGDASDSPFICANIDRLRTEVRWRPSMSLQDGLYQTISWWRDNRTAFSTTTGQARERV